jgi:hypothetical protein
LQNEAKHDFDATVHSFSGGRTKNTWFRGKIIKYALRVKVEER